MKTKDVARRGRFLLAGFVIVAVGACGKDEPVVEGENPGSTALRVEQIIVNPKTAAYGDTLLITAVLGSSSDNAGDIPTLSWTATGGTFIEPDQLTVQWVAPATSDVYTVTARAKNSVSSATGQASVFVAGDSVLVADDAGAVTLLSGGPDFLYLSSTDIDAGMDVSRFSAGVTSDAAPPTLANCFDIVFAPDLSFDAYWADTIYVGPVVATAKPRHIYIGRFGPGTFQRITVDKADPLSDKRQQFTEPAVSPNGHLVAFQGWLPNRYGAAIDSFHVFAYDLTQNTRLKVTAGQRYPRNLFPSFSTDQKWLTFVADPAFTSQWEIYGAPVSGDVVDADNTHLVQLSSTGGSIASGSPTQVKPPLKAWNPVTPEFAVLARDATLYIVQTTVSGGTTQEVTGLPGTVLEMTWSADGSTLATVVNVSGFGGSIYLVTGTSAASKLTVPVGDAVHDLVWSPDGEWMVYRRTRGAVSWFELLDIGAGQLTVPLAITGTRPTGNASQYRAVMSISPAWGSGNRLFMPAFEVAPISDEPGIITIDISSAIQ